MARRKGNERLLAPFEDRRFDEKHDIANATPIKYFSLPRSSSSASPADHCVSLKFGNCAAGIRPLF